MKHLSAFALLSTALLLTSCGGQYEPCDEAVAVTDALSKTYKHKYGVVVSPEDWAARGRDGQIISERSDGVTVTQTFAAGTLQGSTTYTFPHSQTIQRTETFRNGACTKIVSNYPSGLPQKEEEFTAGGSRVVTEWYEAGNPRSVEEFSGKRLITGKYYNSDDVCDSEVIAGAGERRSRDAYGQLVSSDAFVDGQMVTSTTFHSNGAPKEYIPFENGVVAGLKRTFHPGGEPNTVEEWVAGRMHGTCTMFRNGEIYSEIPYEQGRRHGVEKRFREGTQLGEEVTWINDQRHGPSRSYVGDAVKTDWYFQGKLVSRAVFDQMSHS